MLIYDEKNSKSQKNVYFLFVFIINFNKIISIILKTIKKKMVYLNLFIFLLEIEFIKT